MVSAFDSGSSGPGSSPGCAWSTPFILSASLYSGVQMVTESVSSGNNSAMD